ncbi:hypothetical protein DFH11DRAFT_604490 [Phellopilus nigrolimitatus]|nr:hypothetical protein DFH11DRAFT_604490 [Phellopilus nigrolimitatus]
MDLQTGQPTSASRMIVRGPRLHTHTCIQRGSQSAELNGATQGGGTSSVSFMFGAEGRELPKSPGIKGKGTDPAERSGSSFLLQSQVQSGLDMASHFDALLCAQEGSYNPPNNPHLDNDNRRTSLMYFGPVPQDVLVDSDTWVENIAQGRNGVPRLGLNMTELVPADSGGIHMNAALSSMSVPHVEINNSHMSMLLLVPASDFEDEHERGNLTDDSMPGLLSVSDSDDDRGWLDFDTDDSMPGLESLPDNEFDDFADEPLVDMEEGAGAHACWAEVGRTRWIMDSDSETSAGESSDDESEEDAKSRDAMRVARAMRKRRRRVSGASKAPPLPCSIAPIAPPSSPVLPLRRVTNLDDAAYAAAQARLRDALNLRALEFRPPRESLHNTVHPGALFDRVIDHSLAQEISHAFTPDDYRRELAELSRARYRTSRRSLWISGIIGSLAGEYFLIDGEDYFVAGAIANERAVHTDQLDGRV